MERFNVYLKKRALEDKGLQLMEKEANFQCPNCGKEYQPKYTRKDDAPEGSIWKEQHISGICSDRCWNKFVPKE